MDSKYGTSDFYLAVATVIPILLLATLFSADLLRSILGLMAKVMDAFTYLDESEPSNRGKSRGLLTVWGLGFTVLCLPPALGLLGEWASLTVLYHGRANTADVVLAALGCVGPVIGLLILVFMSTYIEGKDLFELRPPTWLRFLPGVGNHLDDIINPPQPTPQSPEASASPDSLASASELPDPTVPSSPATPRPRPSPTRTKVVLVSPSRSYRRVAGSRKTRHATSRSDLE